MVAIVGPGGPTVPGTRGLPGGRSGRLVRPVGEVGDGAQRSQHGVECARRGPSPPADRSAGSGPCVGSGGSPRRTRAALRPRNRRAVAHSSSTPPIVRSILHQLAGARRPVILAGAGVLRARATNDLVQFAEMLEVPGGRVVAPTGRVPEPASAVPRHDGVRRCVDGSAANPRGRRDPRPRLAAERDRHVRLRDPGARPARGRTSISSRAPATHGLSAPTLSLAADVRSFLRSAIERLKGGALEAAMRRRARGGEPRGPRGIRGGEHRRRRAWTGTGVHPGRVVATLSRVLTADTILTTDAGNFASWAARGYRFRRPATFIGPTSGAMGYGFPAAIAARAGPAEPAVRRTRR